ncbi:MAG: hypothetical protein ACRYFX_27525 [Janthinobacterium lividum]
MPTLSPLAVLATTLAAVCQQAQQHQVLLSKNEAATRAVLIDPVLRALGWDTTDVAMVEPERTVQNKQSLDYVLKTCSGSILAVIEAKKLGESLDKIGHVGALIGYAFSLKPQAFFITDGLHWHCYSPEHSHYEPITTLHLTNDTSLSTALQLLRLLDAAHGGHGLPNQPKVAVDASPNNEISQIAKSTPSKANKQSQQKHFKKESEVFTELASLSTLALQPGQKPTKLRLPDGTIKAIHTWKDILFETSSFLLLHKKNISLPLPDKAGKKRFLLSSTKPPVGSSTLTSYQGKPVFIYTHYSATDCIANALYAEHQLPTEARSVNIAVAF